MRRTVALTVNRDLNHWVLVTGTNLPLLFISFRDPLLGPGVRNNTLPDFSGNMNQTIHNWVRHADLDIHVRSVALSV